MVWGFIFVRSGSAAKYKITIFLMLQKTIWRHSSLIFIRVTITEFNVFCVILRSVARYSFTRTLPLLSGAPYGPNRSDWAFALLHTAPCREETLRKNTASREPHPHLFEFHKNSHVEDGILDCSIRFR